MKISLLFLALLVGCGVNQPAADPATNSNSPVVEVGRVVSKDEDDNLASGEVKLLNSICTALKHHESFAQSNLIDKNVVLNYKTEKKECGDNAPYTQEVGLKLVAKEAGARFERVRGGNQFFAEFETSDDGHFD